jgi:hypothetical protein
VTDDDLHGAEPSYVGGRQLLHSLKLGLATHYH